MYRQTITVNITSRTIPLLFIDLWPPAIPDLIPTTNLSNIIGHETAILRHKFIYCFSAESF